MANERMDQKPSGTAYLDDIVITAHPTTGAMSKVTVEALLAASTYRGGGGGDVTPPTVTSATVQNADPDTIVVVFSESVTGVSATGWSFKKNGSAWAISTVTGSGTTWNFNMATAAASGDTLLRSYNSGTGTTVDGASNELVSFTDSAVTNNVSGGSYQTESDAFFAVNTGLTTGEKDAVDDLVIALKAIGWGKFDAVYPFVGGSAAAHKWNLVNPADTDAAFRLTMNGTLTHNANGVTGDGTSGYMNTHLQHSDIASPTTSSHVSVYSRTNSNPSSEFEVDIQTSAEMRFGLVTKLSGDAYGFSGNATINSAVTTSQKLFVATRQTATAFKLFQDNTQVGATNTTDVSVATPNSNTAYLLASNVNGSVGAGTYSARNIAFVSFGDGLSDGEVASLTTAVNAYQTALSRNV